jgi:hypothetical protein
VTVPEFMASPTPVPHQVQVFEFLPEIPVCLRGVVNIVRSFLGTAAFAPDSAISPRYSLPHGSPYLSPVITIQVSLVIQSPSHESAFQVETKTHIRYLSH